MNEISSNQSIKGRTTSTDRSYTSIESTQWLLEKDITTVGTF